MKFTFWGAAGEVTGSQHLLETSDLRLLLDCGLFQGHRAEARRKNEKFHCNPENLDGVILSHAHIDHCGNLPGLYRAGYRGPIFCTDATADIAEIMLYDSAKIQAEDANYLRRKGNTSHLSQPLYTEDDVKQLVKRFEPLDSGNWHELGEGFRLRFREAGHILGSVISELEIREKGQTRQVVFTGDLGRRNLPLLHDPELIEEGEILITESTYAGKIHPPPEDLKARLGELISETARKGGRIIIPAFALGRTQQLVYFLNQLSNEGKLPDIPVFVDSPLSNRITQIFKRYQAEMDHEVKTVLKTDVDPFQFHRLTYIGSQQESMEINRREGAMVIIAASGMCESGRVLHHLKHAVDDPNNLILMIGFQAEGTLGRRIQERQPYVRVFDREYPLKAQVESVSGLSGHADSADFQWWIEHLARHGGLDHAFLVHGEPNSAKALAEILREYCNEEPIIPRLGESFTV